MGDKQSYNKYLSHRGKNGVRDNFHTLNNIYEE